MEKIEKQRLHFDNISEKYYHARQSANHLLFKDLMWTYFFKNKEYLKKDGMEVLEPMCGYAEGKTILEKHLGINIRYKGFDYSDEIIKFVTGQDKDINVIKLDITRYSPVKTYDLIILIGGLHHIPDYAADSLLKVSKSLRDKGYMINFEPTHNNFLIKKIRDIIYKRNPLFDRETERSFSLKEINDMYKRCNLKIVDQIYPGLLSYVLYYNPDAFSRLNKGRSGIVKFLFSIDKCFFRNFFGRHFSFATLTLLQKDGTMTLWTDPLLAS